MKHRQTILPHLHEILYSLDVGLYYVYNAPLAPRRMDRRAWLLKVAYIDFVFGYFESQQRNNNVDIERVVGVRVHALVRVYKATVEKARVKHDMNYRMKTRFHMHRDWEKKHKIFRKRRRRKSRIA